MKTNGQHLLDFFLYSLKLYTMSRLEILNMYSKIKYFHPIIFYVIFGKNYFFHTKSYKEIFVLQIIIKKKKTIILPSHLKNNCWVILLATKLVYT